MRALLALALTGLILAGCATPPPGVYVGAGALSESRMAAGRDASGESCTQQPGGADSVDIFCGDWDQPSAHARKGGPVNAAALPALAVASPWRATLDARYVCGAPRATTILGGQPAEALNCTRRVGGWPQVAVIAAIGGIAYTGDGVLPAFPVLERAIGVLSGRLSAGEAAPPSGANALFAARLAAQSFSAGDVGQYERLMDAATRANLAESFASAEQAFRAALALNRKALGPGNPDAAVPLMLVALQVSDQGRFAEADSLFAEAERLAPRAGDRTAPARLLHGRALNEINQGHFKAALALLDAAEAAYAALLPADALRQRAAAAPPEIVTSSGAQMVSDLPPGSELTVDPDQRAALIGVIETERYRAIALRALGRPKASEAAIDSAATLADAYHLRQPILAARLYRTAATTAASAGMADSALSGLARSAADFTVALPGTRPIAVTDLLRAGELHRQGRDADAAALCQRSTALLAEVRVGVRPELLEPCLDADAAASRASGASQKILAEMFETAQLAQGGITSREIGLAAARLAANARDPRVGAAIRRRQDAEARLADLTRQHDEAARGRPREEPGVSTTPPADLDLRLAKARTDLADADAALQEASPNYGQLVQEVVPASAVLSALGPDESFAGVTLTADGGWTFLLRRGAITVGRVGVPRAEIDALVGRLRASIESTGPALPRFDTDAAHRLYVALFAGVEPGMAATKSLIVAPTGSLLSIPFGVLLTGPGDPDQLGAAPWLIRRMAVAHVPAAANFVALRRIAGDSRATTPWYGFGDFRPATLVQAERTFPAACGDSAKLFAGLPRLAFSRRELNAARILLGGSPNDELLGAAFTVPAVLNASLKNVRVLHFAAHALLPQELRCESEPAIITSVPAGASNASGAFLTASRVTGLDLDADVVILSACNTGGPGGTAGESLSGLARSFFYAGARALMVTHWSVNDQAAAFIVADTLRRYRAGRDGGLSGSLRATELGMIASAGHGGSPAELSHPFYWAPFALIGEGGTRRGAALGS